MHSQVWEGTNEQVWRRGGVGRVSMGPAESFNHNKVPEMTGDFVEALSDAKECVGVGRWWRPLVASAGPSGELLDDRSGYSFWTDT